PSRARERSASGPPPRGRMRLLAASVTTSATLPRSLSSKPHRIASTVAARRAAPTWLASVIGSAWRSVTSRSLPPDNRDARPLPDPGVDLELVHQPLRAGETHSQPLSRGVAVHQRLLHVRDAGPLVLEREAQPPPHTVLKPFQLHRAAFPVDQRVPGQLTRGRHDLGLLHRAERQLDGPAAHRMPHGHDVGLGADRYRLMPLRG